MACARWHDDADAIIEATGYRRRLHRHADRYASRLHAALRGGGQAGLRREADGDEPRAMRRDDRRMPRGARAAVGRLLPARAAAVPEVRELIEEARSAPVRVVIVAPACSGCHRAKRWSGQTPWRVDPALLGRRILLRGVRVTPSTSSISCSARSRPSARFADNQAGAYVPEDIVTASWRFASGMYGSGAVVLRRGRRRGVQRDRRCERPHPLFDVHAVADRL